MAFKQVGAGWRKSGRKGDFISLVINQPLAEAGGAESRQGRRCLT